MLTIKRFFLDIKFSDVFIMLINVKIATIVAILTCMIFLVKAHFIYNDVDQRLWFCMHYQNPPHGTVDFFSWSGPYLFVLPMIGIQVKLFDTNRIFMFTKILYSLQV